MASTFPVNGGTGSIYTMVQNGVAVIAAGLAIAAAAWAQDSGIDAAKQFFAQYVALEQAYDPSLADLYAEAALIKTTRRPPMGDPVDSIVPVAKYKTQVRDLAPVAKIRGDHNTY